MVTIGSNDNLYNNNHIQRATTDCVYFKNQEDHKIFLMTWHD